MRAVLAVVAAFSCAHDALGDGTGSLRGTSEKQYRNLDTMRSDQPYIVRDKDGVIIPGPKQPDVVPGNPFESAKVASEGKPGFGRCGLSEKATTPASVSLSEWFATSSGPPTFTSGSQPSQSAQFQKAREQYHENLVNLNITKLYEAVKKAMLTSQDCWPADGPQNGDIPSYAGLFNRLAWHCSGTYRNIDGNVAGGCEGGRMRFWPENEWHDNVNLDKARAILADVKEAFGDMVSWGDLFTFAGTVAIVASGGPKTASFCFGRVDQDNGFDSIPLQIDGINGCDPGQGCQSDTCNAVSRWPQQDPTDHPNCNSTQGDFRYQASHAIGLIYVHADGPQLKHTEPEVNPAWVHQRSPSLSAKEVRDTFKHRMGWTDRETVALIAGGHTLGRAHGACSLSDTKYEAQRPFNMEGPWYEAEQGSGRGPTSGICGEGSLAGLGPNTISSGFEGAWTRTPSAWNYDYLNATFFEEWEPVKSPFGADQWWTTDRNSPHSRMMRLTTDLSLAADPIYRQFGLEFIRNRTAFDEAFANAWKKLTHRSQFHPEVDDLEKSANKCTDFSFVSRF